MALYHPLQNPDTEIRLLHIADAVPPQPIQCSMTTVSLVEWSDEYRVFLNRVIEYFSAGAAGAPGAATAATRNINAIPHPREYDVWVSFRKQQLGDAFQPGPQVDDDDDYSSTTDPQLSRFTWGDYETISYTWGSETNDTKHTISVNGISVTIGDSLHSALSCFRDEGRYRPGSGVGLWADAICLNQADIQEKSVQVGRMRDIFAWSARSVIWLGRRLPWFDEPSRAPRITVTEYAERLGELLPVILDFAAKYEHKSEGSGSTGSKPLNRVAMDPAEFLAVSNSTLAARDTGGMPRLELEPPADESHPDVATIPSLGDELNMGALTFDNDGTEKVGSSSDWDTDTGWLGSSGESLSESSSDCGPEDFAWGTGATPDSEFLEFIEYLWSFTDLLLIKSPDLGRDWSPASAENAELQICARGLLASLIPLFSHDYWTRVWIIQELVFSSTSSILYLAGAKLKLARLADAASFVGHESTVESDTSLTDYEVRLVTIPGVILQVVGDAHEKCELWDRGWTDPSDRRPWMYRGPLLLCVVNQSTIPADKLYAAHGLLRPALASAISIDYGKPTQRVARDATLALIREMGTIPHFPWSRPFHDPDLPSWAVDLTQGRTYIEVLCPRLGFFIHPRDFGPWDADEFFQRQVKHGSSGGESWRILVIKATRMDTVDGVTAYPNYRGSEIARDAKMAATHANFSFTNTRRAEHSYPNDEAVLSDLSRLLGMRLGRSRMTLEDLGALSKLAHKGRWPANVTADQIVDLHHTALFLDANASFVLWGFKSLDSLLPARAESGDVEEEEEEEGSSENGGIPKWLTGDERRLATRRRRILKQCELFNRDCRHFRLVTTANGWLGMADRFVKSGDELFVLEGCAHGLVVLRPFPGEDCCYEFIGMAKVPRLRKEMREKWKGAFEMTLHLR